MPQLFQQLYAEVCAGRGACLLTVVGGDEAPLGHTTLFLQEGRLVGSLPPGLTKELAQQWSCRCLAAGRPGLEVFEKPDGSNWQVLLQPSLPAPGLVVVGAGHIGAALACLAPVVGLEVTVLDDRPSFLEAGRFPPEVKRLCGPLPGVLDEVPLAATQGVVVATRGHRYDRECLRLLLPRTLAYVGLVSSRHRWSLLHQQLVGEGFSPAALAAVYAPVGLDLGAETPGEIALSILAEVVHVLRRGSPAPQGLGRQAGGLTRPIPAGTPGEEKLLHALAGAEAAGSPAALASIVSTSGSTPRGLGTRMLVGADGSLTGTIGGGCAEAEVRQAALEVIRQGQARLLCVDMDNDPEEGGLACGGTAQVLLQPLGAIPR